MILTCILHALHVLIVMMNFLILNIICKFYNSFVPDFENVHYFVRLNDNMNRTLLDSNSDEEIVLDITGFHDEEV